MTARNIRFDSLCPNRQVATQGESTETTVVNTNSDLTKQTVLFVSNDGSNAIEAYRHVSSAPAETWIVLVIILFRSDGTKGWQAEAGLPESQLQFWIKTTERQRSTNSQDAELRSKPLVTVRNLKTLHLHHQKQPLIYKHLQTSPIHLKTLISFIASHQLHFPTVS